MSAPPSTRPPAPPMTDLEIVEVRLLNADLKAKRRVVAGTLSHEEYAGLRRRFDAALAAVRLLAVALDTPSIAALTYQRGTP